MDAGLPAFRPFAPSSPSGGAGAIARPGADPGRVAGVGAGAEGDGFSGVLKDALQGVSRLQDESAALQRKFQLGAEGVSLEQTMMAMQRSQVAFQAALTVRNRLVSAYTDIMNMPL